jgi:hypothetical protein
VFIHDTGFGLRHAFACSASKSPKRARISSASAGVHAELAGFDLLDQERMRPRRAIEMLDQHLAEAEGEIEANQIGI